MNRMMMTIMTMFVAAVAVAGLVLPARAAVTLELSKDRVEIGTFYNGTTVHASGTIPAGTVPVLRVSGRPETLHLKKKGKAAGILWMNIGDLTFANAPRVYMLYSGESADDLFDRPGLEFSFAALQQRVTIEPADEDKGLWFGEFLKLKKHDKVYAEFPGRIKVSDADGHRVFQVDLELPPRMSEDDYTVELYAVKDGAVVGKASRRLEVRMVGLPRKLSDFAFNHGLLFGVFAVVVAVAAGLLMGTIFKGKGGAH